MTAAGTTLTTAVADAPSNLEELVTQIMEEVFREVSNIPLPPNFSDVLGLPLGDFFEPDQRCQQVVMEGLRRTKVRVGLQMNGNDLSFIQANVTMQTAISSAITRILQIIRS